MKSFATFILIGLVFSAQYACRSASAETTGLSFDESTGRDTVFTAEARLQELQNLLMEFELSTLEQTGAEEIIQKGKDLLHLIAFSQD